MVTVGSKTPVSILQEYAVSKKQTLKFEQVGSVVGLGTHNPYFTIRATLGELFANGSGNSKQQAKHNSAEALLDIIKHKVKNSVEGSELDSTILSNPQDNLVGFNAVGALLEYCTTTSCPEPVYCDVRDEGPPHAKIFYVRCTVSNLTDVGVARTKKQAKHLSAQKMLTRLKELSGEEVHAIVSVNQKLPPSPAKSSVKKDADVDIKHLALSKLTRKPSNSAYIADSHRALLNYIEKSESLAKTVNSIERFDEVANKVQVLEKIADELCLPLISQSEFSDFPAQICFVKLPTKPAITSWGVDYNEAAGKVLDDFLSFLI